MQPAFANVGKATRLRPKVSIYANVAGSDIEKGALIQEPLIATVATDGGAAVLGTNSTRRVIGVTTKKIDVSSEIGLLSDGSLWQSQYQHELVLADDVVFNVEYDLTDTMAVASVSTTDITITGVETGIYGGAVLAVGGTGIGELNFIKATSTNTLSCYNNPNYDATTTLIKILPENWKLAKLSSDATKFGTDAAAGALPVKILETVIQLENGVVQKLDFDKHDQTVFSADGTNLDNIKVIAKVIFRNIANAEEA